VEFTVDVPAGANFVPSSLIYKWAKSMGFECWQTMDGKKVRTPAGVMQYQKYSIAHDGDTDHVTVYMEPDQLHNK